MSDDNAVVFDGGSFHFRAGIAGDELPTLVLPSVVSNSGECGQAISGSSDIQYPIQGGLITNLPKYFNLVEHSIRQLRKPLTGIAGLYAIDPFETSRTKEELLHSTFENYEARSAFMVKSNLLSLYASGRTSGIVLDVGDQSTTAASIIEGVVGSTTRSLITGMKLGSWLLDLLPQDQEFISRLKKTPYNSLPFTDKLELTKLKDMTNTAANTETSKAILLPDGTEISLSNQLIDFPDFAFGNYEGAVSAADAEIIGLQYTVKATTKEYDVGTRNTLFSGLTVSGALRKTEWFSNALLREMIDVLPTTSSLKIAQTATKEHLSWVGGSILCSLCAFTNIWVTSSEYAEAGPTIIHRKVF